LKLLARGGFMKYEKPQKGNPHKLTYRQHVFPVASIDRFSNADGRVSLFQIGCKKTLSIKSDNEIFCAMRVWNQRAEHGYMKDIEDQFQVLADAIIKTPELNFGKTENNVISSFFSLWSARVKFKNNPLPDQIMKGVTGGCWTKDEEEVFERHHCHFVRENSSVPSRDMAGLYIQTEIDAMCATLANAQWGLIRAAQGEFIVPDCCPNMIIPLTPTSCLVNQGVSGIILQENVVEINRYAIAASREYYFARDLSKCPQ